MTSKKQEIIKTKLKWKVINHEIEEIDSFGYSFFMFRFRLTDAVQQQEFATLVARDEPVAPEEICNFFLEKGIWYTLSFRPIPEAKLMNIRAFNHVLKMNRQKKKIYPVDKKYIVKFSTDKKLVNGKNKRYFKFELYNRQEGNIYFIQVDSTICWKPVRIHEVSHMGKLSSFGWLTAQIGVFCVNLNTLREVDCAE